MKFVHEVRLWLVTINFYCQKLWYYIDISRLVDYVPLGDPIFNRAQLIQTEWSTVRKESFYCRAHRFDWLLGSLKKNYQRSLNRCVILSIKHLIEPRPKRYFYYWGWRNKSCIFATYFKYYSTVFVLILHIRCPSLFWLVACYFSYWYTNKYAFLE